MKAIKKGYLPYIIGEALCLAAEVVLFFFALHSDSLFALLVSIAAIAAVGACALCAYKMGARKVAAQNRAKRASSNRAAYPLAIISLILLCNPNFSMVDVLPDFIACFILAKLLSPGIERAPYFAEAKRALVRLGWLNVGKLGGLLIIGYSRMQNAFGNDTSVVVVTVFAAAELVLSISAVTAVFNALFGLGERTDIRSTISPIGKIPVAALPTLCYVFFGVKAILNAVPSFFLLTRIDNDGVVSTVAKGYSFALVASTVLVLACGVAWCTVMIKYLKQIHKEGQFYNSIYMLSGIENEARIENLHRCAKIKAALTLLFAATLTLVDIKFDNTLGINLLPNFIFGILAVVAVIRLRRAVSRSIAPVLSLGAVYTAVSLTSFATESYFLYNYGYSALLREGGVAHSVYNAVELFATLELISLSVFVILLAKLLIAFAYENTAIPPTDERYSRADRDFHRGVKRRIVAFAVMLTAVGLARCVNVYSNGFARLVLNQQATATISSALPWMGAVATALLVLLIGFSYYLFSTLKEELDMKYGGE